MSACLTCVTVRALIVLSNRPTRVRVPIQKPDWIVVANFCDCSHEVCIHTCMRHCLMVIVHSCCSGLLLPQVLKVSSGAHLSQVSGHWHQLSHAAAVMKTSCANAKRHVQVWWLSRHARKEASLIMDLVGSARYCSQSHPFVPPPFVPHHCVILTFRLQVRCCTSDTIPKLVRENNNDEIAMIHQFMQPDNKSKTKPWCA